MKYIVEYDENSLYSAKGHKLQPGREHLVDSALCVLYILFGKKEFRRMDLQETLSFYVLNNSAWKGTRGLGGEQFNPSINYLIKKDYIIKNKINSKKVLFYITSTGEKFVKKYLNKLKDIPKEDESSIIGEFFRRVKDNKKLSVYNENIDARFIIRSIFNEDETDKDMVSRVLKFLIKNSMIKYDKNFSFKLYMTEKMIRKLIDENPSNIKIAKQFFPEDKLKKMYPHLTVSDDFGIFD